MINHFIKIIIITSIGFTQKINLNNDNLDKIYNLNLSIEQINEIINYRNHVGTIYNIYELLSIPNISIQDIHAIRSSVTIDINLFLSALTSITGNFENAITASSRILAVQGKVFPATNVEVRLWA